MFYLLNKSDLYEKSPDCLSRLFPRATQEARTPDLRVTNALLYRLS